MRCLQLFKETSKPHQSIHGTHIPSCHSIQMVPPCLLIQWDSTTEYGTDNWMIRQPLGGYWFCCWCRRVWWELHTEQWLVPTERFPWNHSKGIYMIGAYHNFHCVVSYLASKVEEYVSRRLGMPLLTRIFHNILLLPADIGECRAETAARNASKSEGSRNDLSR